MFPFGISSGNRWYRLYNFFPLRPASKAGQGVILCSIYFFLTGLGYCAPASCAQLSVSCCQYQRSANATLAGSSSVVPFNGAGFSVSGHG